MPVQHFAQPNTKIDSAATITEIRWDFGYQNVDILESGHVVARINDPELLIRNGVEISTNQGTRFVMHVKSNTSDGPFVVLRNDIELVGGLPNWGTAPTVAGKMVHLANELFEEEELTRTKLDRPIRIAQSWMGFLSFTGLVFAYLGGLGASYVPERFLPSLQTLPVTTSAIAGLTFMALAIATQRRTAVFLLPFAQVFVILNAALLGKALLEKPKYPHFAILRVTACALTLWVLVDSWNSIRNHRKTQKQNRRRDKLALAEIEKTTVQTMSALAAERGHLNAWQVAINANAGSGLGELKPEWHANSGKYHEAPKSLDLGALPESGWSQAQSQSQARFRFRSEATGEIFNENPVAQNSDLIDSRSTLGRMETPSSDPDSGPVLATPKWLNRTAEREEAPHAFPLSTPVAPLVVQAATLARSRELRSRPSVATEGPNSANVAQRETEGLGEEAHRAELQPFRGRTRSGL